MTEKFFNTAGPVIAEDNYCLDPLKRILLDELSPLIEMKRYFVLHAPRQTGKTSSLLALMRHLNAEGSYRCLYANVENAQAAREDVGRGIRAAVHSIAAGARDWLGDGGAAMGLMGEMVTTTAPESMLEEFLTRWCEACDRPTVLLLDEVDALVGDTLISLLRQIRSGYPKRPARFPQTAVLCGVRDVRDYRLRSADGKDVITGGSAFNVKAESIRLGNFTREEMAELYAQHSAATGQVFEEGALSLAWELTRGQPWLVNAMGYEACFRMKENRDRTRPITAGILEEAKENLILRRDTHLDQLADKLREDRVRRVIAPLLAGEDFEEGFRPDDISYVEDLGLVRRGVNGRVEMANGIYREVVPRELTWPLQSGISQESAWYAAPGGRLDLGRLLAAFQEFFREHSESWVERYDYKEAGPQLLLQAFLQRVVNGGGAVEREYGLGTRRTDLLVKWPHSGGVQRAVIELKVQHKSRERTIAEGLAQTRAYMDRCGSSEGHLVIFDRTPGKGWEEKIFRREEPEGGSPVTVWGM